MPNPAPSPDVERRERLRFYASCVYDLHEAVRAHGLARNGPILVRGLLRPGYDAIASYYESDDIRAEFQRLSDFEDFMVMLSICFGLLLAALWHQDSENIEDAAERVASRLPVEAAQDIIEALFDQPVMADRGSPLFDLAYGRFCAMLAPHRGAPDEPRRVLYALTAAFQLGVTLMLERCAE